MFCSPLAKVTALKIKSGLALAGKKTQIDCALGKSVVMVERDSAVIMSITPDVVTDGQVFDQV